MKQLKQFVINLLVGFILLNMFGWAFLTGESFPVPIPKTVTVSVPYFVP